LKKEQRGPEGFDCPYCQAPLGVGVLSCRACGRDLTTVLPLLSKISRLEARLADMEQARAADKAPVQMLPAPDAMPASPDGGPIAGKRNWFALPLGFVALLLAYATVVLWLDLPLSVLLLSSIVIPLATGFAFFGARYSVRGTELLVALAFAAVSVLSMNAILARVDQIPVLPQSTAAWRETMYYLVCIGASMLSGILLRLTIMALGRRQLASLPHLRDGLLAVNKNIPLDTLRAIELTVMLLGALVSAIAGIFAGITGLSG
ncbi:MAG: hypothetical protein WBF87_16810, partial [Mesorhizobium sp.]